ncbi:MAG: CDP-diacylglycerol--glycerol-3-phosphate 3-phosphatidyltransferase [Spirochaetales bacterium]|nr:CDP-diacylglycerol--glycerol-3-phosphate 3-phosphatidyltransferase [Spirochaetales bacterium]MCF7938125.1 CDP-diacylglycerol--glycerol-3-phosphate 3-phosphatidyltransferase [Spirochaetales bacterium]
MKIPNLVTSIRIALSPVFFAVFVIVMRGDSFGGIPALIVLWVLFILIEISDVLDGYLARRLNQVSDIGKVLDPFSDIISRMTYFLCFMLYGILPAWVFLVLIYREFGMTFYRMLKMSSGIAVAARWSGKVKAVMFALTGVWGLVVVSFDELGFSAQFTTWPRVVMLVLAFLSVGFSVLSFLEYGRRRIG